MLASSAILLLCGMLPTAAQDHVSPNLNLSQDSLPKYPKEARKQKVEGIVRLRLTIARDGNVANAALVSGDSKLADAAEKGD